MRLVQKLIDKTKINGYSLIENIISFILGGLIGVFLLIIYLINCINTIYNKACIKPIIYPINYDNYVSNVSVEKIPEDIIEEPEEEIIEDIIIPYMVLNANLGTVQGPQEIEKYYNLPMNKVVQNMRNKGYTEEDYPYHVTDDGIKMLGDFIIVAADLNEYPRGTIVQTTLGQGIVCDHCETPDVIDLAVEW